MENKMLTAMKNSSNFVRTENGALTHKTTNSAVLDMFATGGAMRKRSDEDKILMFKKAYDENPTLALKCLFYLRDVRGGQGERDFFKVCFSWFVENCQVSERTIGKLIALIPFYGRWDDLYCLVGTKYENKMFGFMKQQLILDSECKTPSLLAKWLKSENTSSEKSRFLARKTRIAFGISSKQYRILLSENRSKINIVEKLMSQGNWDKIEFDKIPSKAGFKYKNAFARNDVTKARYQEFMKSKTTKVNAGTLYPYEIVNKATHHIANATERNAINKYWDNLTDYFKNKSLDAVAVIDTSASMRGTPLDVACALGIYMAERNKGPFYNHYISFSRKASLVEIEGIDFVDKVRCIYRKNLCENTNIESVFDLIFGLVISKQINPNDIPKNIFIISDMEFDAARGCYSYSKEKDSVNTLMEKIKSRWNSYGLQMPHLIFWNVDARQNNIPMKDDGNVSYVSGFSPVLFETVMSGKTGYELMLEKLLSKRYSKITLN